MLLSTSGTRTTLPLHTRDTAPIKSKVAPQITAAQGIDYYSTAHTVPTSLNWEGHRRCTNRHTVVDTLYVVITVLRSHYTCKNMYGRTCKNVYGTTCRIKLLLLYTVNVPIMIAWEPHVNLDSFTFHTVSCTNSCCFNLKCVSGAEIY